PERSSNPPRPNPGAPRPPPRIPASPKIVRKNSEKSPRSPCSTWTPPGRVPLPVRAEGVVSPPLLGVGEDLVGFGDLAEALAVVLALGNIRVVLARQLPVRGLDGLLVRRPFDAQNSVVVLELDSHVHQTLTGNISDDLSARHSDMR